MTKLKQNIINFEKLGISEIDPQNWNFDYDRAEFIFSKKLFQNPEEFMREGYKNYIKRSIDLDLEDNLTNKNLNQFFIESEIQCKGWSSLLAAYSPCYTDDVPRRKAIIVIDVREVSNSRFLDFYTR